MPIPGNNLRDNSFMATGNLTYEDIFVLMKGAAITNVEKTVIGDEGFVIFFDKGTSRNQRVEVAFSGCEGSVYLNGEKL